MSMIEFKIALERFSEQLELEYLVKGILRERLHALEFSTRRSHVADYPAITCSVYLRSLLWQEFFSTLQYIKAHIEERGVQVLQIIIGEGYPPFNLLYERRGVWISAGSVSDDRDLLFFLREANADLIEQEWFFLPFKRSDEDSEYEICPPGETIQIFGNRANPSSKRVGAPINLRLRMMEGYSLSDYVSAAFEGTLESMPNLGGTNIVLTTLLQMNDKLSLVNYYSEKLISPESLDLYSLSAMNLTLVNRRDETDIALLTSSGKLVIEDIKLGG